MRLWKKVFLIATIIEIAILGMATFLYFYCCSVVLFDPIGGYMTVQAYPYRQIAYELISYTSTALLFTFLAGLSYVVLKK